MHLRGRTVVVLVACCVAFGLFADSFDNWTLRNPVVSSTIGTSAWLCETIVTSRDALSWSNRVSGVSAELSCVGLGRGTFVAVGKSRTILQSDAFEINGGDFSDDGSADMVLYAKDVGQWFIRSVSGSLVKWGEQWGGPGMEPVSK